MFSVVALSVFLELHLSTKLKSLLWILNSLLAFLPLLRVGSPKPSDITDFLT